MFGASNDEKAYLAPFAAFLLCFLVGSIVSDLFDGMAAWPVAHSIYWVLPLQTLVSGALLWHYWPRYALSRPSGAGWGLLVGTFVFGLWIAPRWLTGTPRLDGFDPHFFAGPLAYAANLSLRFIRLVVVVPLLEEIFWRGFLARYLVDQDFLQVPVGRFTWLSFTATTLGFCFEHTRPDWPAAFLTGMLYNFVAWRTRSLSTCVLTHALTNLLLGLYVMRTGEWGYW